jgi:hypothetical protein
MAATALAAAVASGASAQAPAVQPAPVQPAPRSEFPSIRVNQENVRLNNYLRELAGPPTFISVIGGGALHHLRKGGGDGLAGEIGSRAGQVAVETSVRHGLAALMNRSTDYQPCECSGFAPRVGHALLETLTDRGADGSRAFSVPRIAGAYAGGFAQLAWDRGRDPGDVIVGTTLSFGFSALFNIARELTGVGR